MSDLGNRKIMARNIRRYMDASSIDRSQLCKALGIKYTTLADWINAKTYPRIDKIELLANYFGVTKADLVEDKAGKGFDERVAIYSEYFNLFLKLDEVDRARIEERMKMMLESEKYHEN